MKVFLIGFMGSGKTTAAEELGRLSGLPSTDMDHEVQRRNNTSVTTMFSCYGEDYFRKAERELLEELCAGDTRIIATGGGTPCFADNMELINKSGISVYLKCSADELYGWLKDHKAGRPLISHKTDEELKHYIADTLALREPFYSQAHIIVESYATSPEKIWGLIRDHLRS